MKVEDILKNAPSNISKDMLMRYIYLELGKMYRRDVNFFYGTDEEKAEIYNRKIKLDTSKVIEVCLNKGHIYYITERGTSEYKKLTAEQMIEYMENEEWHFLKEKKNLEQPEETK